MELQAAGESALARTVAALVSRSRDNSLRLRSASAAKAAERRVESACASETACISLSDVWRLPRCAAMRSLAAPSFNSSIVCVRRVQATPKPPTAEKAARIAEMMIVGFIPSNKWQCTQAAALTQSQTQLNLQRPSSFSSMKSTSPWSPT